MPSRPSLLEAAMEIRLPPFDGAAHVNVVIETPRGSRAKYAYDPANGLFELRHMLPAARRYPYDFGFVPSTRAEDGDPLDILVLVDEPVFPGSRLRARLVGVLRLRQSEEGGAKVRNDRLLGVCDLSESHAHVKALRDLPRTFLDAVARFFVEVGHLNGKEIEPLGWSGPTAARALVRAAYKAPRPVD